MKPSVSKINKNRWLFIYTVFGLGKFCYGVEWKYLGLNKVVFTLVLKRIEKISAIFLNSYFTAKKSSCTKYYCLCNYFDLDLSQN
jgi:hypothetical protein